MFKGFYNLTSGMLSQGRRLDVVANNMANVATTGYKEDTYTDSTFHEFIVNRVGNKEKSPTPIGGASYILAPSQLYTDYTQGSVEETGMPLDFAIEGDGFFAIQSQDGVAYTRNGNFALDEEGFLCLADGSRVLDIAQQEIYLGTDKITADGAGAIYRETDGGYLAQIGLYAFADNGELERDPRGYFVGGGNVQAADGATIRWKAQERANTDLLQQMTTMITAQRAFQSAAQVSKMYDALMTKATTNLGNV